MKIGEIPYARLLRQRIAGKGLERPVDAVRWMGAVQAQDYAAAKWAVGMRTSGSDEAQIEEAFTAGEIARTHVMRPTWHFVAPEDLRWMQALTSPRVKALMAYSSRQTGLDAAILRRSCAVLAKALRDGKQLTRTELSASLDEAGIPANGLRLANILIHAELEAVICSGGRRGKQFTYALVDERAPQRNQLARDESLALLTSRYFTSHGPATARDYAWWSGLSSADVKRGLEMVRSRLICAEIDGQSYWMTESAPAVRYPLGAAHLLGNYDEYIVGYSDRSAIFDDVHAVHLDARHNPLFQHTIVSRGRVVGTWKRPGGKAAADIAPMLFRAPGKVEAASVRRAIIRLQKFWGLWI